ncbi:glycosyltransferase family 4 protein [Polaribacter sp. Asnod1-A03]|uniref:glycosyltransferase family 4 protein n=1 Tax=Polaribacter sp. Asnod1-A03 TaxID=3160581 RepID=UPI003869E4EB
MMNNKVETILISPIPLPYDKIGSWTVMYSSYLKNNNSFNYIICPAPNGKFKVEYSFLKTQSTLNKIKNKLFGLDRFSNYFDALENIIDNSDKKYLIHIVDNSGLIIPLNNYLENNYHRKNFYIQYAYHGYDIIYGKSKGEEFFSCIEEMFFLTNSSYNAFLNYYNVFTPKVRVLHNGIDSNKFKLLENNNENNVKKQLNIENKTIFIWCSQDRPKKGLDFILEIWIDIYNKYNNNIVLLIIGTKRTINIPGVINLGSVANDLLPKYYQISDIYLFPALWKEGFGLVLAEALKCGCYCIASNQGGIPEVLQYGRLGRLIDGPNKKDNWIFAIEETIENLSSLGKKKSDENIDLNSLYNLDDWCKNITLYIEEAKESLSNRYLLS